jgi:hypothetical protein
MPMRTALIEVAIEQFRNLLRKPCL